GGYGKTLEFYQPLCGDRHPEKRNFARERWIATKRKQEIYHRNKKEFVKAEDIYLEIQEKTQQWGIDFNLPLLPYPDLSKYVLENQIRVPGFPSYIPLKRLEDGNIQFQVGEIEVQTKGKGSRRVLCFEDGNSFEDLRVILHDKRVSGSAKFELSRSEDRLSFEVKASGYSGDVFFSGENKYRMELTIRGLNGKVFVEI
ncbi:MAG: hypothetical protein F6K35_25940, partial [Okeania sp. SIO2H7]|nr:hypothetical protein [Okeania sp. SIO2H7]